MKNWAKIAFKFLKASGKFHPKLGELRSIILMYEAGYSIVENLDIEQYKIALKLVDYLFLTHHLQKTALVYGDFLMEKLVYFLSAPHPAVKFPVSTHIINCELQSITELNSAVYTRPLTPVTPVFIIDNVDKLQTRSLAHLKKTIGCAKHPIVLCTPKLVKPYNQMYKKFAGWTTQFQLGSVQREWKLHDYILVLFLRANREFVLRKIQEYGLNRYFLDTIAHNLSDFYSKNDLFHNTTVLTDVASKLYKVKTQFLIEYLVLNWRLSKRSRNITYPEKIDLATIK